MNKLEKEIFERTYQSYLCGSDIYTYKIKTASPNMREKIKAAVSSLAESGFLTQISETEGKIKLQITEKGIDYGNLSL